MPLRPDQAADACMPGMAACLAGEKVEWDLSKPRVLRSPLYESGAGIVNLVALPVKGFKEYGEQLRPGV
jgi:hypothetical protein